MKLLLDQMFPTDLAELLRSEGHDPTRVSEIGLRRGDDAQVLDLACQQDRVLVTLDQHFGDWVVLPLSRHPGVVRLKVHPTTTQNVAKLLVPFLASADPARMRNHL